MNILRINAAQAALAYLEKHLDNNVVLGIGTGSTVGYFIQELARLKHRIDACVPSSKRTEEALKALGIPTLELNAVTEIPFYIDSADEINALGEMIKGGGGALTREKIIASASCEFICIVDDKKCVRQLGQFPLAVEVIPIARSFVARELVKLGGSPYYREGFITDNQNIILDVHHLTIETPIALENTINAIPGVVDNGLFAKRTADKTFIASSEGVTVR